MFKELPASTSGPLKKRLKKDSRDTWVLHFPQFERMEEIIGGKSASRTDIVSISDFRKRKRLDTDSEDSDFDVDYQTPSSCS